MTLKNTSLINCEVGKCILLKVVRGQFVAFQDGDGPWTMVPFKDKAPTQKIAVSNPSGKYSIFVGPDPADAENTFSKLIHGVAVNDDLRSLKNRGKIDISIANPVAGGRFMVGFNGLLDEVVADKATSLEVPDGIPLDLCFAHYKGGKDDDVLLASSVLLERAVPTGGPLTIDWSNALSLGTDKVQVKGLPSGFTLRECNVHFRTMNGGFLALRHGAAKDGQSFDYPTLPESEVEGTDMYVYQASAFDYHNDISVTSYNNVLNLPKLINPPVPVTVSKAPGRFRFTNIQPGAFRAEIRTGECRVKVCMEIKVSREWLGGQSNYTMPDLTRIPGWKNSFGIPSGSLEVTQENITTDEEGNIYTSSKCCGVEL